MNIKMCTRIYLLIGMNNQILLKIKSIFQQKIKKLKFYIVEFEENGVIKPKVYLVDYVVGGNNWQQVIIRMNNKCTFSANDKIKKA